MFENDGKHTKFIFVTPVNFNFHNFFLKFKLKILWLFFYLHVWLCATCMPDASRGQKKGGESVLGAGLSGGTAIVFNDQAIFPADAPLLFNLYHVF